MNVNAITTLPKLAAVLGMLGSEHDGEALNAARLAERLRRQMGVQWDDLLGGVTSAGRGEAGGVRAAHTRRPDRDDWRALAARCLQRPDELTEWERRYLAALPGFPRLSPRQAAILAGIAAKVAA